MMLGWFSRAFDNVTRALPIGAREQRLGGPFSGSADREDPQATLYAAVAQSAHIAFVTTDTKGVVTGWNPGAERVFGYTAGEIIGKNIDLLVPRDRRDEIDMIREKFRSGELLDNFATIRLAKGNRPIHVIFDISPVPSADGGWAGSWCIARDVSEQRLVENLFRLAVEASPSGMLMFDRVGKIVMANNRIEELFGYRREELMYRDIDMLIAAGSRANYAKVFSEYAQNPQEAGPANDLESVGLRKDGSEFPIEIAHTSISIHDGLLVLGVIVDITERKRNDRLKDEFVSAVSHELRTPLTSIAASLALLSSGAAGQLPPPAQRLVTIAHNNGERLVRLVNDILDIQKIESGAMVFNSKQVSARSVVEQVVETSHIYAQELGIDLRIDPSSVVGELWSDPDRLAQGVTNLVSNAVKFSPRGEEVTVAVSERNDRVRITVRDHGPGIPEEFKPHVFERFAQADASNTRAKGGTGLGLSIVKQIVNRMGGEVGFESENGDGTLFFVELPKERREEEVPPDAIAEARPVVWRPEKPGSAKEVA